MILLNWLKDLSDKEKLSKFDEIIDYCEELQEKNINYKIHNTKILSNYKGEIYEKVRKDNECKIHREATKRLKEWKIPKLKEISETAWRKRYLDLQKLEKELFFKKWEIRAEILKDIAEWQKLKHPILNLPESKWKSRQKLYPIIMNNPYKTPKAISLDANTSKKSAENAVNELMASWEIIASKIPLIKRMVTRWALTIEKAQEILLGRLLANPDSIQNKDLISAIKNSTALYTMFVWQATDKNWWILEKEDQKILDDVLWKHLE